MATVYNAALMEHNAHPEYKYHLDCPTHTHDGVNPNCGDAITLAARLEDGVLTEVAFTGSGCAVSQASADIMADTVTDLSVGEARERAQAFLRMIAGEASDEDLADLGEAAELESISRMPARVKCAELGWRTLLALLDEADVSVGESV